LAPVTLATRADEAGGPPFKVLRDLGQPQYGGLKAADAKRLKELEKENQRLKRIVADQLLENQALQEIARGNW